MLIHRYIGLNCVDSGTVDEIEVDTFTNIDVYNSVLLLWIDQIPHGSYVHKTLQIMDDVIADSVHDYWIPVILLG